MREAHRDAAGLVVFVALAFFGTWAMGASVKLAHVDPREVDPMLRFLVATLLYVVVTGAPPLLALWIVRRFVEPAATGELALQPASSPYTALAIVAPLGLTCTAASVLGAIVGWPHASVEGASPSWLGAALATLAFVGTLSLVWAQATIEEVSWRGFVLDRLMTRFGAQRGLLVHGALWGVWYAPIVCLGAADSVPVLEKLVMAPSTVIACGLVGTLLGWLRLASGSLVAAVLANGTLTLAAGVPYVIEGLDAGPRGAIFGPIGWVLLALVVLALARSRHRFALRLPGDGIAAAPLSHEVLPDSRTLH